MGLFITYFSERTLKGIICWEAKAVLLDKKEVNTLLPHCNGSARFWEGEAYGLSSATN